MVRRFLVLSLSVSLVSLLQPVEVHAQIAAAGVEVNPQGVLTKKEFRDPTGRLTRERLAAARAALNPDVARPSKLRKVSLTRLEREIEQRLTRGEGITDEMRFLVGLTRLTHVFFYPDSGDIVVAGPAEGFGTDISGRPVGIVTGRAVLELQDLIVAMRAYSPQGRKTNVISVSIDPTREGLQRMQQFLVSIAGRVRPNDATRIAQGLRDNLGLQTVSVRGISPKTHFAQVLVEADYRMKLIGIGLERPPVRIQSYVDRANPRDVSRNAMQRWFFTPNYECVKVSNDRLAMQLEGDGVKLVSEDEMVQGGGQRVRSGQVNRASKAFVNSFTSMYSQLSRKSPVYAQMRNLIDMSIAAAFIQQEDYYNRSGWNMDLFSNEERFAVETHNSPEHVETAVNVVWKGNTLMTPVGGGVNVQPRLALAEDRLLYDEGGQLQTLRAETPIDKLAADQWWWD